MKKRGKDKKQREKEKKQEFFRLGIIGFDSLVNPGVPIGTSNLVEGVPEAAKQFFV